MGFVVDAFNGAANRSAAQDTAEANNALTERIHNDNLALQTRIHDEAVAREEPFRNQSLSALPLQGDAIGLNGAEGSQNFIDQFRSSAFHRLPFEEGRAAIEGSAAARGGLLSGATGRAITEHGQRVADNNFLNFFNGVSGTARQGQVSNQTLNAAGNAFGANVQNANTNFAANTTNNNNNALSNITNANNQIAGSVNNGLAQAAQIFGLGG